MYELANDRTSSMKYLLEPAWYATSADADVGLWVLLGEMPKRGKGKGKAVGEDAQLARVAQMTREQREPSGRRWPSMQTTTSEGAHAHV